MTSEELDGVDETAMKRGSPPHSGRPHAPLTRHPREESGVNTVAVTNRVLMQWEREG